MLLIASSVLAQSEYDRGSAAYKRGDYATALDVFKPLAENGDAKAQSILGMMYSYGEGLPVDYRESARWYRRAAEQNYSVAQYNLGMAYLEGKGVQANTDDAIEWLTKAADNGHFRARSKLANLDAGYYSNLQAPPRENLEAPPTVGATQEEPRSVVMRKRAPAAPPVNKASKRAPEATASAAAVTTASVVATPPPAKAPAKAPAPAPAPVQARAAANVSQPSTTSSQTVVNAKQANANSARTYRVQLAASRSEENIRRDWSNYQQRYGDIFAGLDGSVERAEIGEEKTVWYRLRVGPFTSEASAKELCSKLLSRNIKTGCLPLRASR
jgi:cell division septation protein DedD